MGDFHTDLATAQEESEEKYREYLRNKYPGSMVMSSTFPDSQYSDTVVVIDGRRIYVENKYDIRSQDTGNVFLELFDDDLAKMTGIIRGADWVVYNFPLDDTFYRFNPRKMLYHLITVGYMIVRTNRDPNCIVYGAVIPLEKFKSLGFMIKENAQAV